VQEVEKPKKLAPVIDLMAALKESLLRRRSVGVGKDRSAGESTPRARVERHGRCSHPAASD